MLRYLGRDKGMLALAGMPVTTQHLVWLADARCTPVLQDADAQALLKAVHEVDLSRLTAAQRFSLPNWLAESMARLVGETEFHVLANRLLEPAALDIRVNTGKTNRSTLIQKLRDQAIQVMDVAPAIAQFMPDTALRISGHPALENTDEFRAGLFEIQDAGSQVLARLAGVRRG